MSTQKYCILKDHTLNYEGKILYRIQAIKNFGDVKNGDIGGWVEKDFNLSHKGDCWVYDDSKIFGTAAIYGNAKVYGNSAVGGSVYVFDNAWICGNATIISHQSIRRFSGQTWISNSFAVNLNLN